MTSLKAVDTPVRQYLDEHQMLSGDIFTRTFEIYNEHIDAVWLRMTQEEKDEPDHPDMPSRRQIFDMARRCCGDVIVHGFIDVRGKITFGAITFVFDKREPDNLEEFEMTTSEIRTLAKSMNKRSVKRCWSILCDEFGLPEDNAPTALLRFSVHGEPDLIPVTAIWADVPPIDIVSKAIEESKKAVS